MPRATITSGKPSNNIPHRSTCPSSMASRNVCTLKNASINLRSPMRRPIRTARAPKFASQSGPASCTPVRESNNACASGNWPAWICNSTLRIVSRQFELIGFLAAGSTFRGPFGFDRGYPKLPGAAGEIAHFHQQPACGLRGHSAPCQVRCSLCFCDRAPGFPRR